MVDDVDEQIGNHKRIKRFVVKLCCCCLNDDQLMKYKARTRLKFDGKGGGWSRHKQGKRMNV